MKTIKLFRLVPWGKMIGRGLLNILLFILYHEGQSLPRQKRFKFYPNKVWHGFKDSNMMKSLQYFSLSIFYALTWPDLKKKVLSFRIRNFKTCINRRWLGQENDENVVRTKNCCSWPSSPWQVAVLKVSFLLKGEKI